MLNLSAASCQVETSEERQMEKILRKAARVSESVGEGNRAAATGSTAETMMKLMPLQTTKENTNDNTSNIINENNKMSLSRNNLPQRSSVGMVSLLIAVLCAAILPSAVALASQSSAPTRA